MSKENARAYALLRQRDALKRTRQVWLAGLVIWAVVLGWVVWGLVNSFTDNLDVRLSWAVLWLLPVLVLGGGTWLTHRRLKACDTDLRSVERHG